MSDEIVYTPYACSKLSKKVMITSVKIDFGPKGKIPTRTVVVGCDSLSECGVMGEHYKCNWAMCVHPNLNQMR